MPDTPVETHMLEWNGIRIEIRYGPSWSESYERIYGYPLAHLEIEARAQQSAAAGDEHRLPLAFYAVGRDRRTRRPRRICPRLA